MCFGVSCFNVVNVGLANESTATAEHVCQKQMIGLLKKGAAASARPVAPEPVATAPPPAKKAHNRKESIPQPSWKEKRAARNAIAAQKRAEAAVQREIDVKARKEAAVAQREGG